MYSNVVVIGMMVRIWVAIQNWPKFRFLNYYDLSKHGSFNHKKGHLWYWNDNVRTIIGVVTIIYCKGALTIKQGDVVDKWWSILLNTGGYTRMVYYRWDDERPQWGYLLTNQHNGMTEGLEHCSDGFDSDVTAAQLSPRIPKTIQNPPVFHPAWCLVRIPSLVLSWFRLVGTTVLLLVKLVVL